MERIKYGTMTLPDTVDITDPAYDEAVWCRINDFPIEPGDYECYADWVDDKETNGFGDRVSKCGIRKKNSVATHYERKAIVGVDSGLAGFFNCENKKIFEDEIQYTTDDIYIGKNYFVTSSGYGDGGYDVYAGYMNGKVVEVYIEFI